MTRKQLIASKKKEISKIETKQRHIMKRICLERKPPKSMKAQFNLAVKIVSLAMQFRQLEVQKHIIISQPIPKANYKPHEGGPAIFGEIGKEVILSHEDAFKKGFIKLEELSKKSRIFPKFQ